MFPKYNMAWGIHAVLGGGGGLSNVNTSPTI
jgi:hypothetical protein